jgi:hypothetical protein
MGTDQMVVETLKDYRTAAAQYAGIEVHSDEQRQEAKRLRAELDGARLRYVDALRAAGRWRPRRAA